MEAFSFLTSAFLSVDAFVIVIIGTWVIAVKIFFSLLLIVIIILFFAEVRTITSQVVLNRDTRGSELCLLLITELLLQ